MSHLFVSKKMSASEVSSRTGAGSRDIGGEGVQQGLLKLLEGRELFVPLNVTQHWSKHDFVQMDTTDILFLCAGTFTDIHMYEASKRVGFEDRARQTGRADARRSIAVKDLLEYGMLAELLSRLPVIVQLGELTESELGRVLTEPPDSLVKEYHELLRSDDVALDLTPDGLGEIVRAALRRGLGARGLRSILEEVLADALFEAPEMRGASYVVDAQVVRGKLAATEDARKRR